MKLIDKPHCKKHEVYTQACIGCRIKLAVPRHDMVATNPDEYDKPRKSANITELKKLLKAIRNSGAEDTQRSLQADVETITELFS